MANVEIQKQANSSEKSPWAGSEVEGAETSATERIRPLSRSDTTGNVIRLQLFGRPKEQEMANGGPPSREEIDAKLEAVEARLESRLSYIVAKLDGLRVPSHGYIAWTIAAAAFAVIIALAGINGLLHDRFEGGMTARDMLNPLIQPVIEAQQKRDEAQDQKLDQILRAVEYIRDKPQGSPPRDK